MEDGATTEDIAKTGALVGLGNTLLSPFYYFNTKVGISASIAATAAFLYSAHEVGKERRPVANTVNTVNNFFSPVTDAESTNVRTALDNIAVGGAVIFDEARSMLGPK